MKKDDKLKEIEDEKTLEEKVKEEEQLVVELQEEIEKEKIENKELNKENRKLRFFNSFLQILLFILFVIVVFVGGWYFGTKLAEWENENINSENTLNTEKNDEEKESEENKDENENDEDVDREISFSKTEAGSELDEVFGSYLSIYGLNTTGSKYMDLYNEKYDKLAIVPLTNVKVDSNSSYSYVTYEEYKNAYKRFYCNTDNLDKELKMYPDDIYPYLRKDGNVYFQVFEGTLYENSFIPEKIMYTAIDKTYTMTGIYAETSDYGDAVTANFELKYKIDVNGNKYVVGMKITKE